jgi:hypothetical protein
MVITQEMLFCFYTRWLEQVFQASSVHS